MLRRDLSLQELFGELVERAFALSLRWDDRQVICYLTNLLTEFAHMDNLYRLRDLNGRPLQEVAEMLYYADVRLGAQSFYQEREVHRHIGDFTLFWTGVYPEALPKLRASLRKDHLIDYVKQGKESYGVAVRYRRVARGSPDVPTPFRELRGGDAGLVRRASDVGTDGARELRAVPQKSRRVVKK